MAGPQSLHSRSSVQRACVGGTEHYVKGGDIVRQGGRRARHSRDREDFGLFWVYEPAADCDPWTFDANGKIVRQDRFWKIREGDEFGSLRRS